MRFSYLILVLGLYSCHTSFIKKGEALIISNRENKAEILDLDKMEIRKAELPYPDSTYHANHVSFSEMSSLLSIALPQYDFSTGHSGLHHLSKPGGALVIPLNKPEKKLWIDVPDANYNTIINRGGTELWTSGYTHRGRVYVYALPEGTLKHSIPVDPDPSGVIFSPDEKYAVVACGESSFVNVIDTQTYKVFKNIKVDPYPDHVWPGYENKIFVENRSRKSLNIIDLDQMKVTGYIDFDFEPGFMKYNAMSREIWIAAGDRPVLYVYSENEKKQWERKGQVHTGSPVYRFAFYRNFTKLLALSPAEDTIMVLDCDDMKLLKRLPVSQKPSGIMIFE